MKLLCARSFKSREFKFLDIFIDYILCPLFPKGGGGEGSVGMDDIDTEKKIYIFVGF